MLNRVLGGAGRLLIFSGVTLLLFVAYQLWGTSFYESASQDDLTQQFAQELDGGSGKGPASEDIVASDLADQLEGIDPSTAPPTPAPPEGEPGGFIEIPEIGLTTRVFVEGVAKPDLRKGPGHYPSTPFPGQPGNAGIAGHRTTYGAPFNRIDELTPGDRIHISTRQGTFSYEVMAPPAGVGIERGPGWFSVLPTDTSVIAPTDDNRLTLTACHPKYSAKQRIVVQARLVTDVAAAAPTTSVAPGTPGELRPRRVVADDLIGGDSGEKTPALVYGGAFLVMWLGIWVAAASQRRREATMWPILVFGTPASAVLLWFCFVHLDRFLPSY